MKRQGLQILKVCAMDEAKAIRVSSLENVRVLTQSKRVQALACEIGLVDVCKSYVRDFSIEELDDELVDLGVFCASIDVLSSVAEGQRFEFDDLPAILATFLTQSSPQVAAVIGQTSLQKIRQASLNLCKLMIKLSQRSKAVMIMTPQLLESLLPILAQGINNMSSPRHPTVYTEQVLQNLLGLFIEQSQRGGEVGLTFPPDILQEIVDQNEYLDLAGQACLLLSMQDDGQQYLSEALVERLLFLADFNKLITESDPEASVESLQQISLFAFLALIKLTGTREGCELASALDAMQTIIKQIKNGVYEPKQTALACLANLLAPDLPENHVALVKANGVMLLCELISDEDDDEISDRAYVCLKKLGMLAIN